MTRVIVGLLALSVLLAAGFQAGGGHYAGSTPKRFSATLLRDGEHPDMAPVRDAPIVMKLVALRADGSIDPDFNWYRDGLRIDGLLDREDQPLARFDESGYQGHATWSRTEEGALLVDSAVLDGKITVHDGGYSEVVITRTVFGLAALLPALVAIVLAIVTRQVLFALFCGIWIGGWSLTGGPWSGFQEVVTELLPGALDSDRVKILIFSSLLGALVALVARMGGTRALVDAISGWGQSRRGAQLTTWFTGLLIFFDDYANALLVGNTMRPITDRHRVSREKLSFLVDCTSAPVACIFVVSTWIAAEIACIQGKLSVASVQEATGLAINDGYQVFLATIPYNFYPIYCLVFSFAIALFGRDYGPMLRAERRALEEGKLNSDGARPLSSKEMDDLVPVDETRMRWWNAVLPIGTVVVGVVVGLWVSGSSGFEQQAEAKEVDIARLMATESPGPDLDARISAMQDEVRTLRSPSAREILGAADSYRALLTAAFLGALVAMALAMGQRLMPLSECLDVFVAGVKAMIPAVLVLVLAWTLQGTCERVNRSQWLIHHVSFTLEFLPVVIFLLAGIVGFSTGTSWGTMGILVPLTIDYAVALATEGQLDPVATRAAMIPAIGGVLAGAVFGDHCSPISDTTIMSSMASGADHIDHVRTQLPYALTCAMIAMVFGYLPAGFGMSWYLLLPLGVVATLVLVYVLGRPVDRSRGATS